MRYEKGCILIKKDKPLWKKVLLVVVISIIVFIFFSAMLLAYLTVTEYRPEAIESLGKSITVNGKLYKSDLSLRESSMKKLKQGKEFSILSWNIGYGALGDDADFFLDGGKEVRASSKERVHENLQNIIKKIKALNSDIAMLQEVDVNSKRSYGINQSRIISNNMNGTESSFATNYKVPFIPYPIPPIGKVEAGIQIQSKFSIDKVCRIQLPVPFSWPERLGNLKRCLLVGRIPIKDSKKDLVMVNLHMEAYDNGSGKTAQTNELFKLLEKEKAKGNYVIAGGDFNQTFSSANILKYKGRKGTWKPGIINIEKYKKNWQFVMDTVNPSCRSLDRPFKNADKKSFQYYVIDGFILSKNIKVKKYKNMNLQFKNADHNPVLLKVELKR